MLNRLRHSLPVPCPYRLLVLLLLCLTRLSFFQEAFQKEGKEIGECVELAVPTNVLITELDAVFHIWIGFPLDEIVQ